MIILQVWESIPNHLPKLSRPPSLADVHFPHYSDLPKPDLAKKLNSLHAHFSALPKTLKTLNSSNTETSSNAVKMEGVAAKLKRRGWCGCLRDDEPPEITYCVVDGAGTLSLQAVTPALPMPDEEELNAKFAELVVRNYFYLAKIHLHLFAQVDLQMFTSKYFMVIFSIRDFIIDYHGEDWRKWQFFISRTFALCNLMSNAKLWLVT